MKQSFPKQGSKSYALCVYLWQYGPSLSTKIALATGCERSLARNLKRRGCLLRTEDAYYSLTPECYQYIASQNIEPAPPAPPIEKYVGELVPKREYSVFGKPLNTKHIPSPLGTRAGSNEYKSWPSRHA